mmetsp:Transcript_144426/g.350695  ORF Transcript_144426/g.350695 Transcript_144426/m.350695 type:complete len:80 (+) Transcript_144426:204-443(+)
MDRGRNAFFVRQNICSRPHNHPCLCWTSYQSDQENGQPKGMGQLEVVLGLGQQAEVPCQRKFDLVASFVETASDLVALD